MQQTTEIFIKNDQDIELVWYFRVVLRFFRDNERKMHRNLEHGTLNLEKKKSHIMFNKTCDNNDMLPNYTRKRHSRRIRILSIDMLKNKTLELIHKDVCSNKNEMEAAALFNECSLSHEDNLPTYRFIFFRN